MERPQPLSPERAKEEILLKLAEGKLDLTDHCKYESMPKRKIFTQDIIIALEIGEIKRVPEWDEDYQNWKYRVEGFDEENDELIIITVILDYLIIVTAF
jgi:hypothetical protein